MKHKPISFKRLDKATAKKVFKKRKKCSGDGLDLSRPSLYRVGDIVQVLPNYDKLIKKGFLAIIPDNIYRELSTEYSRTSLNDIARERYPRWEGFIKPDTGEIIDNYLMGSVMASSIGKLFLVEKVRVKRVISPWNREFSTPVGKITLTSNVIKKRYVYRLVELNKNRRPKKYPSYYAGKFTDSMLRLVDTQWTTADMKEYEKNILGLSFWDYKKLKDVT